VTPDGYFAAIGPEGAAAALRRPRRVRRPAALTPPTCVRSGAADAVVEPGAVARLAGALVARAGRRAPGRRLPLVRAAARQL
jgi:hypothetical protein